MLYPSSREDLYDLKVLISKNGSKNRVDKMTIITIFVVLSVIYFEMFDSTGIPFASSRIPSGAGSSFFLSAPESLHSLFVFVLLFRLSFNCSVLFYSLFS